MAKGVYIGDNNETPRKVKKIYIGVNGEPRRVKKAYIGVGGIPRPVWGIGGAPTKYGTVSDVSYKGMIGRVGDYVIVTPYYDQDGSYGNETATHTTVYNSSLTRSTVGFYISGGDHGSVFGATPNGNYAIYFGSATGTNIDAYDYVDYINSSLTIGSTVSQSLICSWVNSATNSDHVVFAGGSIPGSNQSDYGPYAGICEMYNNSLVCSTKSTEDLFYTGMCGVSCGSKGAWFAGGYGSSGLRSEIWAVQKKNGDSYVAGYLNTARTDFAGTKVGDYAFFGGGTTTSSYVKTTEAVSMSGTNITSTAALTKYCPGNTQATTLGDYALFTGYTSSTGGYSGGSSIIEVYDSSLTKQTDISVRQGAGEIMANNAGNYAFVTGRNSSLKGVDVITLV